MTEVHQKRETPAPLPEYVVKSGDNLLAIVGTLFPGLTALEQTYAYLLLQEANGLKNPKLKAGEKLKIPCDIEQKCKQPGINWEEVRTAFLKSWKESKHQVYSKIAGSLGLLKDEVKGKADVEKKADIQVTDAGRNLRDKDVTGNLKERLKREGISYSQKIIKFKGITLRISVFEKKEGDKKDETYLVVHDSEDTAFQTGIASIGKNGGRLIALETGESRYLPGTKVDPNRIFSTNNEYYPIAQEIIKLLGDSGPIIALHNYGITMGLKKYKNIEIFEGNNKKPENVIWIASNIPLSQVEQKQNLMQEINHYVAKGLNVVYEYVDPSHANDSSLSNWAAQKGRKYYNIEIQSGDYLSQREYLASVISYQEAIGRLA